MVAFDWSFEIVTREFNIPFEIISSLKSCNRPTKACDTKPQEIYRSLQSEWTTDVSTLHCYFRLCGMNEVGRQHVKVNSSPLSRFPFKE